MKIITLVSAVAISAAATVSHAQNVTTADGHIVMVEKNQTATVAGPAAGTPVGVAAPVTGFTPLAGFGLGAVGPLALGLGAIIAIGAISGGEGT